MDTIGSSVIRKEALEKVTGRAKYTHDIHQHPLLSAKLVISPFGHARILEIDTSVAQQLPGVRAILTGGGLPLVGEAIRDRPPLASDKVRYHGEPVALVVADTPFQAKRAADAIEVQYEPLPVVHSPTEALHEDAPLVHDRLDSYLKEPDVFPVAGTNIATQVKIRKGSMVEGWEASYAIVEANFSFAPSDHVAMETRTATAEITPDGTIIITTASQAPFLVKKLLASYFEEDVGKIIVKTPLVGGGYGGKAAVQLEILAYLASKAVGGQAVNLFNSREEDILTAPCHIGLDASVKLGADSTGKLCAAEIIYLWDGGAYCDKSADLARAGGADCTGPYNIENVYCDSFCMYTNHPYSAPFRGFSHAELSFAIERSMDLLAEKLAMDPLHLRAINAIKPGHRTPTQVLLNNSNVGDLPQCINRLKELIHWDEGQLVPMNERFVRAKGISCSWKTSTIDPNAPSGAILTFNPDGSINLLTGNVTEGQVNDALNIFSDSLKATIK